MKLIQSLSLFTLIVFTLFSCDQSLLPSDGEHFNDGRKLVIRLTDDPIDAEEVNIDIKGVIIKTDQGLDSVSLETAAGIYNLLDYQNGVDTLIAQTIIDFVNIKEIRLILGDENSIKIDGELYPLIIPSGSQTGLKIKINMDISNEALIEILIDFDALKSVIKMGNGEFHLKPVLKIKKIVKDGLPSEDTEEGSEDGTDNEEGNQGEGVCVRGKGYWKTHSNIGPAALDSAWLELSNGSQTQFFTTGETYISFLVRPSGNNQFVKLAQQYIIAELNVFAGAEMAEEALTAWNTAAEILANNAENQLFTAEDESLAKDLTSVIRKFNSGDLNISSCDDGDADDNEDGEDGETENEVACVRGKGYWKTHSDVGPAGLDSAWLELADGSQTEFFTTGETYMSFLVRPSGNNPYVKLAQSYIIAELNSFAGAELTGDAMVAWNQAAELLVANAETQKFSEEDEKISKELTSIIKKFNSGDLDSVSCDDDEDDDDEDEDEGEDEGEDENLTEGMMTVINAMFPGANASDPNASELCDGSNVIELKINYNGKNIYLIFDVSGEIFVSYFFGSDDGDLPQVIKDLLKNDYDGYKIKNVNTWNSVGGEVSYEIEIQKMSTKKTLLISETGEIICE